MTASKLETTSPEVDAWAVEDEIDLREYIEVLIKWWREIVAFTLVAALAAGLMVIALRLLQPPAYQASAVVAIARTKSDITFDSRFRTLSEEEAQLQLTDANARRTALVGLVSNGAIAQMVIDELGDLLTENEKVPARLLRLVEAEIGVENGGRGTSDLIRITATAKTPEKAVAIANAWARHYVQQINALYGQVPTELLSSVKTELENSRVDYETAQKALEQFMADNRISRLNRLIAEKQATINDLQTGKQTAANALIEEVLQSRKKIIEAYLTAQTENHLLAFSREQEGKRALVDAYLNALNRARLTVFDEQVQGDLGQLGNYYDVRLKVRQLLADARSLRSQTEAGGDGAVQSNALALQLLKAQAFAGSAALPGSLQLQVDASPRLSQDQVQADLDSLIQVLESRLASLDQQIDALTTALLSGDNYAYLGQEIPRASELVGTIQKQYPALFVPDELASLSSEVAPDNPLAVLGEQKAAELLQLEGLENLPSYSEGAGSLNKSIEQLEDEILSLQAQLEAEAARQRQLTQQRDLTWSTYTTLSNKMAELNLSSTAASSEVRFAAPAVVPVDPVPGPRLMTTTGMAGVVGLMLAVMVAFFANFMGREPFLGRSRQQAATMS